ncbi:MAG TPA: SIMPL domain-containing protein [Pseudonocardia sp.]|nr:SIMPL domain-containing protein [Pseudonocardia sp.]
MRRALSTAAMLALGALTLTACASGSSPAAGTGGADVPGITARGVGTITGTPDIVTVVLGVQTQGPSAQGALDANTRQATALINMLKSKGVADADLQTSELSVNPSYNPSNGQISGYEVTNQVTATLHNVAGAGAIIDAAGDAAGDAVRVQQLSFSIDDDSALRAKARADAVKQAQTQARQLADAAGVRLGKVRSITEAAGGPPPSPLYKQSMDAAGAAPVPIQPGSQQLSVSVEIVYDIDQ